MSNLFIEIHGIQPVPAANINRGENGEVKTVEYGGVTRARVSSQSWKRAIRKAFQSEGDDTLLESYRTKRVVELLSKELQKLDSDLSDDDATEKAVEIFKAAGIKTKEDSKTGEYLTNALFFLGKKQLENIAKFATENDFTTKEAKAELKKALLQNSPLDLALFGRMVADDPSLNVGAATQVAHAFSTHEINPEFDFYTAVDDYTKGNTGAGMMENVEFDASTLYRYANVNLDLLAENLGNKDLAVAGLERFIKDFILSMPSGHINTFANHTLPSYVLVNIRKDVPISLASAFETPVKSSDGFVEKSVEKLETENTKVNKMLEKPVLTVALSNVENSQVENQATNLEQLLADVKEAIKKADDEDTND